MAQSESAHCRRCDREVAVVSVWRGFVWAKRLWYLALALLCLLAPIIMSEITVLMPLALVVAVAAGPVHALAAQKPTCSECGAEIAVDPAPLRKGARAQRP